MWCTFFRAAKFIINLSVYRHICILLPPLPQSWLVNIYQRSRSWLSKQDFGKRSAAERFQLSPCQAPIPASWQLCPMAGAMLPPPGTRPRSAVWRWQWGVLRGAGHPHPCLLRAHSLPSARTPDVRCGSAQGRNKGTWQASWSPWSSASCSLPRCWGTCTQTTPKVFFLSQILFHVWPPVISFRTAWYACTVLDPIQALWVIISRGSVCAFNCFVHSFIHSFIQVECLLSARHCCRLWIC